MTPLGDINNDGKADIVGFGEKGVLTALAMGDGSFAPEQFAFANFGWNQGWDPAKHVRLLADINNDNRADIVAFGDAGVWTALAKGDGKFEPEKFVRANFGYDQAWRNEKHVACSPTSTTTIWRISSPSAMPVCGRRCQRETEALVPSSS